MSDEVEQARLEEVKQDTDAEKHLEEQATQRIDLDALIEAQEKTDVCLIRNATKEKALKFFRELKAVGGEVYPPTQEDYDKWAKKFQAE